MIYLHFFNPSENDHNGTVHHLELDGVIKAGSTYLIRGAKHAELDDESAFIKVKTFDKEWYENGKLLSFEQEAVKTADGINMDSDSPIKKAYRFCLTYGLADLTADTKLVERSTANRGDTFFLPAPRCGIAASAGMFHVLPTRNAPSIFPFAQ